MASIMASFEVSYALDMQALFSYLDGKNDEGIKIPMTVPVLTSYIPNEDHHGPPKPEEEKNFTVSFYLQPKIAVRASPPTICQVCI